jgi:hypothetical protein
MADKMTPQDIRNANRGVALVQRAHHEGKTLSALFEELDPSDQYRENDRPTTLDAFGRQCALAGIITRSDPENGIYTSRWEEFTKPENRALGLEWVQRKVRQAQHGHRVQPVNLMGGAYTSQDDLLGSIFRPFADKAGTFTPRNQPQVTLDMLVGQTTAINNDTYRSAFMDEPQDSELHEFRVTEMGEFPTVKVSQGQQQVKIYKYGLAYLMSYEAIRRANLDKLEFWINRTVLTKNNDKVSQALDVLINGDGNSNGATVDNLTAMDPSTTANNLTFKAWLTWKEQFGDSYKMNLAIMRSATKVSLLLLDINTGNQLASTTINLGSVRELNGNLNDAVDIASYSSTPANTIVGIDTSVGVEHIVETGADLTETETYITNQTQKIVISEVEGFAVLDKRGTRILNLAA